MIKEPEIKYTQLFINGEFRNSSNGATFETYSPYTERLITRIQQASLDDINQTVRIARAAHGKWSSMPSTDRASFLFKLADLIEANHEYIARLDSFENGISVREMSHTSMAAASIFRYYAGLADKIKGETLTTSCGDDRLMSLTIRMSMGVCAIIIPWNSPTLMLAKTVAPALACGNVCIVKPAEQTSLSALFIGHLTTLIDDFPPGILNVLTGAGKDVGEPLARHMRIDKITFTGSTEIGQLIMKSSAESNLKHVTLELGGKNPLVIMDDVPDVAKAARLATNAIFVSNGQVCCCGSLTYVHENIYDQFIAECRKIALNRRQGNPLDPSTELGPQVDQQSVNKIMEMIRKGMEQGARLICGGRQGLMRPITNDNNHSERYFIQPTIFADVKESMVIGCEEIFGPVQSIVKFTDLNEVIEHTNRFNRFGLSAGIVTENIHSALRFARAIHAGTCWINCYFVVRPQTPFGGFKMSGIGREFGEEAIREYMQTKTISINLNRCDEGYLFG